MNEKISYEERQKEKVRLENLMYTISAENLIAEKKQEIETNKTGKTLEMILAKDLVFYKEGYKKKEEYISILHTIIFTSIVYFIGKIFNI